MNRIEGLPKDVQEPLDQLCFQVLCKIGVDGSTALTLLFSIPELYARKLLAEDDLKLYQDFIRTQIELQNASDLLEEKIYKMILDLLRLQLLGQIKKNLIHLVKSSL